MNSRTQDSLLGRFCSSLEALEDSYCTGRNLLGQTGEVMQDLSDKPRMPTALRDAGTF